jgi:hypothetical protein
MNTTDKAIKEYFHLWNMYIDWVKSNELDKELHNSIMDTFHNGIDKISKLNRKRSRKYNATIR